MSDVAGKSGKWFVCVFSADGLSLSDQLISLCWLCSMVKASGLGLVFMFVLVSCCLCF